MHTRHMAPLVGRKKELADVLRLLVRDGVRQITITGPPGIGKTRFAEEVVAELERLTGERPIVLDEPGAADVVAARRRTRVAVLVTAVDPLAIDGERVYPLRPLAEAPGVELYRRHAGDAPYDEAVAIVGRLGGNPRAIEQEAARAAVDSRR